MSLPIILRPQARREFDEAADWYEQRRAGLGARFIAAVGRVFDQAAANPQRYPEVFGAVREGVVQRFPYCVYFYCVLTLFDRLSGVVSGCVFSNGTVALLRYAAGDGCWCDRSGWERRSPTHGAAAGRSPSESAEP